MTFFRFGFLPLYKREDVMRTNKCTLCNYLVLFTQYYQMMVVIYSAVGIFMLGNTLNVTQAMMKGSIRCDDTEFQQKNKEIRLVFLQIVILMRNPEFQKPKETSESVHVHTWWNPLCLAFITVLFQHFQQLKKKIPQRNKEKNNLTKAMQKKI